MNEDILKRFEESITRFQEDPGKADKAEYQGIKAADYLPIAKKALEIGEENLTVRIYQGIKEDGHTPELWHRLYDWGKDGKDPIIWTYNLSYPCPPFCGGD